MPRVLKTKFRCTRCGEPAEVRRLAEAQFARCGTCSEVIRKESRICIHHEAGNRVVERAMAAETNAETARQWCLGLAAHLEGVAARIDAIPLLAPSNRRKIALGARQWMAWIAVRVKEVDRVLISEIAEDSGYPVVGGLGMNAEPPKSEVKAPELVLVQGTKGK